MCEGIKADLRRLETLGKPVVAAINGAALGGGLEITLACHHRIVVDDPKVELGLPEATLGLLPGGGGVTRTVRMFGIQSALMDILLQGTRFKPAAAKEKGLVDELVKSRDDLVPAAKKWIKANQDDPQAASNPWDRDGYKIPGGSPSSPVAGGVPAGLPGDAAQADQGRALPGTRARSWPRPSRVRRSTSTPPAGSSRATSPQLITGSNSKNMIQAFFFDLSAINSGLLRPKDVPKFTATKVGVLGAGMMGAGIAYSCARAGMEVVLKDVEQASADKGKAYSDKILDQGRRARQDGREEEGRDPRPDHRRPPRPTTSRAATSSSRRSSRTRR